MVYLLRSRFVMAGLAGLTLSGCAGSGDRYPDLNLRDFERVKGTFTPAASPPMIESAPRPLQASTLAQIEAAIREADLMHAAFLAAAEQAQPIVASAAGTGIEDNRWPVAQIEIASLDARSAEITSLLADLDSLYADASLSFTQREQIDLARDQLSEYHAIHRQMITELNALLTSKPVLEQP